MGQPMGELGHEVLAPQQLLGWGSRYPMSFEAEQQQPHLNINNSKNNLPMIK